MIDKIEVSVAHQGEFDMVSAYREVFERIGKGALDSELIDAAYQVMDRRFNRAAAAAAAAPGSPIRHMFEWRTFVDSQAARLWKTVLTGDVVSYVFLPSKTQVPIDSRLDPAPIHTDHVFVKKAEMFEQGEGMLITPKNTKYLRWYEGPGGGFGGGGNSGTADVEFVKPSKDGVGVEVFANAAMIMPPGGGQFKNEFTNFFLIYWATAGKRTSGEMAQVIGGSKYFRGAVANSLHRRQTIRKLNAKKAGTIRALRSDNTGAAARKQAQENLAEIKRELRRYGRSQR